MRVVVAMSGGVDSSVAAALVKEAGHEAIGVTLKLLPRLDTGFGCCGSPQDIEDAKRVCERLGIPHYVVDLADLFERKVITPFVDSYRDGDTPNPCVECNRHIKFHYLLALADAWGASKLATGHYARIIPPGRSSVFPAMSGHSLHTDSQFRKCYTLLKARDEAKDQTYFLHTLTQAELSRALFPIGDLTKPEVREKARTLGLVTAEKKESFEICFVPHRDYRTFLASRLSSPLPLAGEGVGEREGANLPGDIVDNRGSVLGHHAGLSNYTLGQREGLGIAIGSPMYVVGMDRAKNVLVVGERQEALVSRFLVRHVTWTFPPSSGRSPGEGGRRPGEGESSVEVRIRHRSRPTPAKVSELPDGIWEVALTDPQFAPAPGQSAVFYRGDEVLGGGIIAT